MDALRALHERLGHSNVRNYIQSGNIVFAAKGTAASISKKLASEFAKEFNFAAKVMVVDGTRWPEIARANPFAKQAAADPKTVHVAICEGKPDDGALKALLTMTGGRESFVTKNDVLYLHAPDGFGTSKFAAGLEKAAGVQLTARNWRTVEAILALIQEA